MKQGSGTGQGKQVVNEESVARSLRAETLVIGKTLAMKCSVTMHTLGKLGLLVFLSHVVC